MIDLSWQASEFNVFSIEFLWVGAAQKWPDLVNRNSVSLEAENLSLSWDCGIKWGEMLIDLAFFETFGQDFQNDFL